MNFVENSKGQKGMITLWDVELIQFTLSFPPSSALLRNLQT